MADLKNKQPRSSTACLECRSRKVRCDLSTGFATCSNCLLNARSCTIKIRTRRRRCEIPVRRHQSLGISTRNVERKEDYVRVTSSLQKANRQDTRARHAASNPFDLNGWSIVKHSSSSSHAVSISDTNCEVVDLDCTRTIWPSIDMANTRYMHQEQMDTLHRRRCFALPKQECLRELMKGYLIRVHPQLPILDEVDMVEVLRSGGPAMNDMPGMSIFVLHAMIHVACSFLTKSQIGRLGFESIREARLAYYQRAKTLFELEFERDSLAIAQGALLLTLYTPLDDPVAHTYWLAVAIHHSRIIHASELGTKQASPPRRASQLQRLWWCCIIRDRSISVGLRRPLQISGLAVKSVPLLDLADAFGLNDQLSSFSGPCKGTMLSAFSTYCLWSVCVSDVLEVLFPTFDAKPLDWAEKLIRLTAAEHQIDGWFATTPTKEQVVVVNQEESTKSMFVLQKLPAMYHHAVKAAIHSHLMLESLIEQDLDQSVSNIREQCSLSLEHAVHSMTVLLIDFLEAKAINFLPVAAVALVALPLAWHVMGSQLSWKAQDQIALQKRVEIYNRMLRTCQIMYEGTDRVIATISEMVKFIRLDDESLQKRSQRIMITGPSELANPHSDGSKAVTWKTLLLQRPHLYSQLITGLDVSLSQGRRLQLNDIRGFLPQTVFSSAPTLMLTLENRTVADHECEENQTSRNISRGSSSAAAEVF